MQENRKRDKTLTVRLTESEKANIEKKAAKAKMNLTEYIIAASNKSKIKVAEDTTPLLMELKRMGNNINQIAMKINSGAISSYNFAEVIYMQRKIYEQMLELVGKS
jgi:DNA primase catalytic subunit